MTAELLANGLGIGVVHAQEDIARHDQHARRAEPALQAMALVELATQDLHDGIVLESFEGLYRLPVTHDRQSKT
jgi:hypothetical protein